MNGIPRASVFALPLFFACWVLHLPTAVATAKQPISPGLKTQASIQINLSEQIPAIIHLETRAAPLAQILKKLSGKTGVKIHYSLLPSKPVTATCAGANVKTIIECLLGPRVGVIAKMPGDAAASPALPPAPPIAELWLLPTDLDIDHNPITSAATPAPKKAARLKPAEKNRRQLDDALQAANAKDPEQRATAIYNLGLIGRKNDPEISETLRAALTDEDANIRAQAAASLAQRGDSSAVAETSQAYQDNQTDAPPTGSNQDYQAIALLQKASKSSGEQAMALFRNRLPPEAKMEQ